MSKNPVLKYSQFLTEKMNQNLQSLDMSKGSKITKTVDPKANNEVPKSGKKVSKEVSTNLEALPKGGKMSTMSPKSGLSKLDIKGKSAGKTQPDPSLAKLPGKK